MTINRITSCIKYMHQNYDIEWLRVNRVYQSILVEFNGKQEPTHVPETIFTQLASTLFKLPQLSSTRLYEKLKDCLRDRSPSGEVIKDEGPVMFSLKNFKLLVDLYQFLPSKKNPQGELNTF